MSSATFSSSSMSPSLLLLLLLFLCSSVLSAKACARTARPASAVWRRWQRVCWARSASAPHTLLFSHRTPYERGRLGAERYELVEDDAAEVVILLLLLLLLPLEFSLSLRCLSCARGAKATLRSAARVFSRTVRALSWSHVSTGGRRERVKWDSPRWRARRGRAWSTDTRARHSSAAPNWFRQGTTRFSHSVSGTS